MEKCSTVLMILPAGFGYNPQTAVNNFFMKSPLTHESISDIARREVIAMAQQLRDNLIGVILLSDEPEPHTPDAVFPNNWISFHPQHRAALYPMYAENRRLERRYDIFEKLRSKGYHYEHISDYTAFEHQQQFLEGTGSMVLDRENKIAYAAISERTNPIVLEKFCADFNYSPVTFNAYQNFEQNRVPVYHTNVVMCIADQYAVICADSIDLPAERKKVTDTLIAKGKTLIEITEQQMAHFAGNMLQVFDVNGTPKLIMSQQAYDSLFEEQILQLNKYNELIVIPVPVIETHGGGSVRCMIAELY